MASNVCGYPHTMCLLVETSPPIPYRSHDKSCGRAPCGAMNKCTQKLPFAIIGTEKRVMAAVFLTVDITLSVYFNAYTRLFQSHPFSAKPHIPEDDPHWLLL